MTTKLLLAAASIAALAGIATDANAARFYLTATDSLYTGRFSGGPVLSGSLGLGAGARSPAIAFDSTGQMWAAVNQADGTADMYTVSGTSPGAFAPSVTYVSDLTSPTNSFDFMGSGASERLIGTRGRLPGDSGSGFIYFESTSSAHTAFADTPAANGGLGNSSLPSTGYDAINDIYYGVTNGLTDNNRRIVTIDGSNGLATDTGLSMIFDGVGDQGDAGYGNIQLAGGDYADGRYFISFWSTALDMAVIGTLNLTNGHFTELAVVDVGGQPISMGLAVVIPTPLAGGLGAAGLLLIGARRRRSSI